MEEENFYHVYNRGINSEKIFKEERNYPFFMKRFNQYVSPFADLYAYCLMPTHFHLLIQVKKNANKIGKKRQASDVSAGADRNVNFETSDIPSQTISAGFPRPLTNIEKGFKIFFTSYAKAINSENERHGSLFEHKFKRKLIDSQQYLLNSIVYIHYNPIKDGLVKIYHDWKYSSFRAMLNEDWTLVKRDEVLDLFNNKEEFLNVHSLRKTVSVDDLNQIQKDIENFF